MSQNKPTGIAPEKITKGQIQETLAAGIRHAKFQNKGVQKRLMKNQAKVRREQERRENEVKLKNKLRLQYEKEKIAREIFTIDESHDLSEANEADLATGKMIYERPAEDTSNQSYPLYNARATDGYEFDTRVNVRLADNPDVSEDGILIVHPATDGGRGDMMPANIYEVVRRGGIADAPAAVVLSMRGIVDHAENLAAGNMVETEPVVTGKMQYFKDQAKQLGFITDARSEPDTNFSLPA